MPSSWWFMFMFFFVAKVNCRFQNRILYGKVVDPALYDWSIVQIKYIAFDGRHGVCTGTLISERHILTAIHCVLGYYGKTQTLRYHEKFFVNILHATEWKGDILFKSEHVDIAILQFPKDTVFDKRAHRMLLSGDPMDEPYYLNLINRSAFIAGYGFNDFQHDGVGMLDDKLRIARVPVWPKGWCYGIKYKICTSDYSPVAVGGDSGGPLFFKKMTFHVGYYSTNYQFGIMIQTDIISKYNLHTPILPHCDWIEEATNSEAFCESIFKKPNARFRRSAAPPLPPPPHQMVINESKQSDKDEEKEFDVSISFEDVKVLPLPDLPENLEKELRGAKEYKEMDAQDLYFILNFINICVLFCLAILLCHYSCCRRGQRNVQPAAGVEQKI